MRKEFIKSSYEIPAENVLIELATSFGGEISSEKIKTWYKNGRTRGYLPKLVYKTN